MLQGKKKHENIERGGFIKNNQSILLELSLNFLLGFSPLLLEFIFNSELKIFNKLIMIFSSIEE